MNTPPPPPLHHFHSYSGSSYTLPTTPSERSYDNFDTYEGSDRYSDVPLFRTQSAKPYIETRRPSFSEDERPSSRTTFSARTSSPSIMEPLENRGFLHFIFTKDGSRWDEDPIVEEIRAPQAQIKKRTESKNKNGTAMSQMLRMGPNRRRQIDRLAASLNAAEKSGSVWEPVFIDNTKIKQRGVSMEVKSFEVIYAKRQPKAKRNSVIINVGQPDKGGAEESKKDSKADKGDKGRKEKRKSKDKKADNPLPKGGLVDDPFGETQWFDMSGTAMGGHGGENAGLPSLPPFIPPEKPIGHFQPRIIPGLDPEKDGIQILDPNQPLPHEEQPVDLGVDEILAGLAQAEGEAEMMRGEHRRRGSRVSQPSTRHRRQSSRHRSRSRSRPRVRRQSESANRVRFSGHFDSGVVFPASSNSSVASGDRFFEEVEELSSHTSEETSGSQTNHKVYRPVAPAYRQHRPGPQPSSPRRYELSSNEKILEPGRSRRRSSRAIEPAQAPNPYGVEQPLVRRNTSPRMKPTVHQPTPPTEVPPIAVYPSHFEQRDRQREKAAEQHMEDYMRANPSARERNLQDREAELAQRERAMYEEDKQRAQRETLALREQLESLRLNRELGARRKVYTHEPRDDYAGRRY